MSLILPDSVRAGGAALVDAAGRLLRRAPAFAEAPVLPGWAAAGTPPTLDPQWQARLDQLAPRDGTLSWLKLAWLPGYPWQPVGRWVIYQMAERSRIPDVVLRHLEGPDPRTLGQWDPRKGKLVSTARVSRFQWDLYKETGCFATTFWVIQGSHGGHKAKFDQVEAAISFMNGGPSEPPEPGALPYAPFDDRVICKLLPLVDLFSTEFRASIDYANRRPQDLDARELRTAAGMRAALWTWLSSQVGEVLDEEGDALRSIRGADMPHQRAMSLSEQEERGRAEFTNPDPE